MRRIKLFEKFDNAGKLEQTIKDILVDLRDKNILYKVYVKPDKFCFGSRDINVDIQASFGTKHNLFDYDDVYPSLKMLDDYLREFYSNIDLRVQYFASVNGGTFTDIEEGKDIRLISSIKINYVINED